MELPYSYISSKFYMYSSNVRETQSYINGCCPICREGDNWNKKRRLFYMKKDDYFYCHNCAKGWSSYFWIKEVTNFSFKEILEDLKSYDFNPDFKLVVDSIEEKHFDLPDLPGICVNLLDPIQIEYFKNYPIVDTALQYCNSRRLFTALNRPKTLYVCVKDKHHANRLIIPFYDEKGKIIHYISRKLINDDKKPKYMLKYGIDKPIFNLDKIDPDYPYIFLFEGQIDSFFVKNSVALSGIKLTDTQKQILETEFPFHRKIWVLDNFRFEEEEVKKTIYKKCQEDEWVFIFEDDFYNFKDLADFCKEKNLDFIDPDLILKYSYRGSTAICKL